MNKEFENMTIAQLKKIHEDYVEFNIELVVEDMKKFKPKQ